jgi:hypothetical protein
MFVRILAWLNGHYEEVELRLVNNLQELQAILEKMRKDLHTEVTYTEV